MFRGITEKQEGGGGGEQPNIQGEGREGRRKGGGGNHIYKERAGQGVSGSLIDIIIEFFKHGKFIAFHIVNYYLKQVKTSLTYSTLL